jgi:hypothetical protein
MYKLIILIPTSVDQAEFDTAWPQFLRHAERMPGLEREATARVDDPVFGRSDISRIYEFFFPDKPALLEGLTSPEGEKAGQLIHQMTRGKVTILIAEHREDRLERIRPPEAQDDF